MNENNIFNIEIYECDISGKAMVGHSDFVYRTTNIWQIQDNAITSLAWEIEALTLYNEELAFIDTGYKG